MYNQHGNELCRFVAGAGCLIIVAPYIKADALTKVLTNFNPQASLICVTRWTQKDLVLGVSDIESRTIVKELGGSFRLHESLHAKYYRIDDVILVGSANMTSSALGWSASPNLEILCRPGGDFDALAFQRELLNNAREVSDAEFARWQILTSLSTLADSTVTIGQPRLDHWIPATRHPIHIELSYQGREDDIASRDEQRAARTDIQNLGMPSGMTTEQLQTWMLTCLHTAPFTETVTQLQHIDRIRAYRSVAETYNIDITEARRAIETVENWIALLDTDTLE